MADQGTLEKPNVVEHPSLIIALCAAQAEFDPIIKEQENTHFKSKYATLDAVLDAVRPALNRHGLVLIQPPRMEEQLLVVDTTIIHAATDERLVCTYPVCNLGATHQVTGANLTYARRFALTALLGIFPQEEDDDGAGASDTGQRAPAEQRQPQTRFKAPDKSAYAARKDGDWARIDEALAACRTIGDVDDFMRSDMSQRVPYQWREDLQERAELRQEAISKADEFPGDKPLPWGGYDALKQDLTDCQTESSFKACVTELNAHLSDMTPEQVAEIRALHTKAKARVKGSPQ